MDTIVPTSRESYDSMYRESIDDPMTFWGRISEDFYWETPPREIVDPAALSFDSPRLARWFEGGRTNITYNALDIHCARGRGDRVALKCISATRAVPTAPRAGSDPAFAPKLPVLEGQDMTYAELLAETCRVSNYFMSEGVKRGDVVAFYMPMVPELLVGMLACARIGAIHSVVFAGFSASALACRLEDAGAKMVVTCSCTLRGSKRVDIKRVVDEAIANARGVDVTRCLVLGRGDLAINSDVPMKRDRDQWWSDVIPGQPDKCEPQWMGSNDPLFLLYTSGSTGKPKGVVHSTGGYMIGVASTFKYAFNPTDDDVYWCTADIGWITGHSYVVYAPLLTGATQGDITVWAVSGRGTQKYRNPQQQTQIDCPTSSSYCAVLFEGHPMVPDAGMVWNVVESLRVSILYTAPTLIRSLAAQGNDFVRAYDRSTLRLLGSVGEPINPEAWRWFSHVVGQDRCPIQDTYWQTETGMFMISPSASAGVCEEKPGSATLPFFGVEPAVMDPDTITPDGASKGAMGIGGAVSKVGKGLKSIMKRIARPFGGGGKSTTVTPMCPVKIDGEASGHLVLKRSWPAMMTGLWKDPTRFQQQYFSQYPGYFFTGDGVRRDADGYYFLTGRVDDVINVSGHRLGTTEVESALVEHPKVAEAAVVPIPSDIKGEAIYAYVTLQRGERYPGSSALRNELIELVRSKIGPIAKPEAIHWAPGLPKTRSGKIMRRILRKIATEQDDDYGDISTLADVSVIDDIIEMRQYAHERLVPEEAP